MFNSLRDEPKLTFFFLLAVSLVVTASNILVQYPFDVLGLSAWLTWGAWTYPLAFLICDLSNRTWGPKKTKVIMGVGFVIGLVCSVILSSPRIAIASGIAFASAQLLDISVFDKLRNRAWWVAPAVSSTLASIFDTFLFFSIAFYGENVGVTEFSAFGTLISFPSWVGWGIGDLCVKMLMMAILIIPYKQASQFIIKWRSVHTA